MMSLPVWLPGPMFLLGGVSDSGPMFLLGVSVHRGLCVGRSLCRGVSVCRPIKTQDSTGSKDARISGAHQPNSTNLM